MSEIFDILSKQYCSHRGYRGHKIPGTDIILGNEAEGDESVGYGCSYKYERSAKNWSDWQKCSEENCPFMRMRKLVESVNNTNELNILGQKSIIHPENVSKNVIFLK